MKRSRPDDTQPTGSAERTDPAGFRPPEPEALPTQPERDRIEQLIAAFDRAPQRPSPNYAERPYSAGGNAVGYSAMVTPSPARGPDGHPERVLVDLAELARNAAVAHARISNTGRDNTTVSPARAEKARRLWVALVATAALAIAGMASVRAGSSSHPPVMRAAGAENASISPAAPAMGTRSTPAVAEKPPAAAALPLQATSSNAPSPTQTRAVSAGHAATRARPAPPKPANDPTLDELDRVP